MDSTSCESLLGTAGDVFFYVAPFRYPNTAGGLLFSATLEQAHSDDGVATPFDSGGLVRHLKRADPVEPARAFLARHELPIPEHRRYLEHSMRLIFRSPEDYVEGIDPVVEGHLGLSGGDNRRWTHEVRIPQIVHIRTAHLRAAFASRALIGIRREGVRRNPVEDLFNWCKREGVDAFEFDHSEGDEFGELSRQSLAYIRNQVY